MGRFFLNGLPFFVKLDVYQRKVKGKQKMKVQLGTMQTINAAHQIMCEAFKEYGKLEVPSSAITEPIEVLTENFKNGIENFAICLVEEGPIASVRFMEKTETLYFSRLAVLPAYRGKGIAKYMLQWLENYAKQLEKNKMECKVRMSLEGNIQLYQSIGFHLVEEGEVINPNGYAVRTGVMKKDFYEAK